VAGIRRLDDLPADLADAEVAEYAFQRQRARNGSDFLPHHLQRIITISCALRSDEGFKVWSLAAPKSGEGEIIQRFFDGVEKFTPQLVSWNGGGFDLPVLHYRGLIHRVTAPRYWDMGEGDYRDSRDFKWNNYISRYHTRHTDLMDLLALYQPRASAPLDDLAKLCGFAGKLGMDGSQVWTAYQAGQLHAIRSYCETDVVNTHLIYCRFEKMRGHWSESQYAQEVELVRESLRALDAPHWRDYLAAWLG
jgi:predicted PolB exonuclease-like 3'-5' exonuclease